MDLQELNSHKKRKFKPRVLNTTSSSAQAGEEQDRADKVELESNPDLRRIIPR